MKLIIAPHFCCLLGSCWAALASPGLLQVGFDSSLLSSFIGLGVQQQASLAETEMSSGLPACQPAGSGELLSLGKFFITEKRNSTGSS